MRTILIEIANRLKKLLQKKKKERQTKASEYISSEYTDIEELIVDLLEWY